MNKIVTPYNSNTTKKEQVQAMFDSIAPKYDFLNRFLSFGIDIYWRKRAIKELKKYNPKTILDVACGTADFSIAALKVHPEKITGIDISQHMLNKGIKKIKEKKFTDKIQLIKADSENLQFENNSFDAVTVAFGVRNFENLDRGLDEINRVLKRDSPFITLEFSRPKHFPVKQLFNFYFKTICPVIGRLVSGNPKAYTYLYESVQYFPEGEKYLNHLRKAGFKNTQCKKLTFGICSLYTAVKS